MYFVEKHQKMLFIKIKQIILLLLINKLFFRKHPKYLKIISERRYKLGFLLNTNIEIQIIRSIMWRYVYEAVGDLKKADQLAFFKAMKQNLFRTNAYFSLSKIYFFTVEVLIKGINHHFSGAF